LQAVFAETSDPVQKDRIYGTTWTGINDFRGFVLKEVETYAAEWQDGEYFADLLDKEISNLFQ